MKTQNYLQKIGLALLFLSMFVGVSSAQSTEETAKAKIKTLNSIIKTAKAKGVSTLKEETAVRTAEIFLDYATWDENNIDVNTKSFELVTAYKKEPEKWAKLLPEFERTEIVTMLEDATTELKNVLSGKIKRLATPLVDWTKTSLVGDEILYNSKPVFLADWTWKPVTMEYTEYHGNQDGFFMTPTYVINEKGDVNPGKLKELKEKGEGSMGFVFLNHSSIPNWAKKKYPEITEGPGIKYTMYDINNPVARKIQSDLIAATVPLMAGKQYTKLGYMLCNEPHWNTVKKTWASAPISDLAALEFKKWLENKHKNIATLNSLWGTNFTNFASMTVPKEMEGNQQGTAQWFDFMSFNMDRVTDWFTFLKNEIRKYDPQAKTHLKLMPNLWSDNKRDSGIDMEALTYNSDIIGNDASSGGAWMWGKPHAWEKNYSFDWIELCMAQDFFKSVSPNKIMYNTEGHFLSTGKFRNLYLSKEYVRCNYWQSYIHGLTAIQTWYWARREDGSSRKSEDSNAYAGSNNHQPRVVNEVHATIADLNSVSDVIMSFQRQEKPIRVFYTKASSINKPTHMDDVFATYEKVFFEGVPVGFATKGIIENNDNKSWETILIAKTPFVFESDIAALQSYLDKGGVVIMDNESLITDEYSRSFKQKLNAAKGKLILVNSLEEMKDKAFEILKAKNKMPALQITETNGLTQKGCDWRVITSKNGSKILNIANISKNSADINIKLADGKTPSSVENYLTGEKLSANFNMKSNGVLLLEVK